MHSEGWVGWLLLVVSGAEGETGTRVSLTMMLQMLLIIMMIMLTTRSQGGPPGPDLYYEF